MKRSGLLLIGAMLFLVGCDSDGPNNTVSECTYGEPTACECPAGETNGTRCNVNGQQELCTCGDEDLDAEEMTDLQDADLVDDQDALSEVAQDTGDQDLDDINGDQVEVDACQGELCGELCIDTQSDPAHCGGCDQACSTTCIAGQCQNMTLCGTEWVNIKTDPDHCGFCNAPCDGDLCINGGCGTQRLCGDEWIDVSSDTANCGDCEINCNTHENVSSAAACTLGICSYQCQAGWLDCEQEAAGCETDGNGVENCGGCGVICDDTNGTPLCETGLCAISCNEGFDDCDGNVDNGCETPITTRHDCGACGNACESGQICVDGACGVDPNYLLIGAGEFQMGSPPGELGQDPNTEHYHLGVVRRAFYMKATEVTQDEWQSLMGNNPSFFADSCAGDCPVENISWYDALAYCNALSDAHGLERCYGLDVSGCTGEPGVDFSCAGEITFTLECTGYRLPTEMEWEYAARAGSSSTMYSGDITMTGCISDIALDNIGWHCGNSNFKPHSVGGLQANAWGLYDMAGNVDEWVWDYFDEDKPTSPFDWKGLPTGSARLVRGGSWRDDVEDCRHAVRKEHFEANMRTDHVGLRPVRHKLCGDSSDPLNGSSCQLAGFSEGDLDCRSNGLLNFTVCSAWPDGLDGDLVVGAGETFEWIPGTTYDYNSINVAAGGTIAIAEGSSDWVIVGVSGNVVLNGQIIGRTGAHAGGVFTTALVDNAGGMTVTPGISASQPQQQGGNCSGFNSSTTSMAGNGAGGGDDASTNAAGPNSTGNCAEGAMAAATSYGEDGADGPDCVVADDEVAGFGGGGFRGMHGQNLYLQADGAILGSGSINLSGQPGGAGGDGGDGYNGGNGGGGGAGGNGGHLFIAARGGVSSGISIAAQAGAGGLGGSGGIRTSPTGSYGSDGSAGAYGLEGIVQAGGWDNYPLPPLADW